VLTSACLESLRLEHRRRSHRADSAAQTLSGCQVEVRRISSSSQRTSAISSASRTVRHTAASYLSTPPRLLVYLLAQARSAPTTSRAASCRDPNLRLASQLGNPAISTSPPNPTPRPTSASLWSAGLRDHAYSPSSTTPPKRPLRCRHPATFYPTGGCTPGLLLSFHASQMPSLPRPQHSPPSLSPRVRHSASLGRIPPGNRPTRS